VRVQTPVVMPTSPAGVFDLVSDVARWPDLLPHYRFVTPIGIREPGGQRYRMSARRSGLPVRWTSVYRADASTQRLHFTHVGGATKGMAVEWRLEPHPNGTLVTIEHVFDSRWPVIGPLATWVICRVFVEHIAGKTLRRFQALAGEGCGQP
jgi:ribosome-associated toxin RatA of RatAB toxin-antitoxin module